MHLSYIELHSVFKPHARYVHTISEMEFAFFVVFSGRTRKNEMKFEKKKNIKKPGLLCEVVILKKCYSLPCKGFLYPFSLIQSNLQKKWRKNFCSKCELLVHFWWIFLCVYFKERHVSDRVWKWKQKSQYCK